MRKLCFYSISSLLMAMLLGTVGCDKANAPQTALPVEELPAAVDKAFSKAKPDVKELADQMVKEVQAEDYPNAFHSIQTLVSIPDLTKEQSSLAGRAMLTINELLQSAAAKGEEKSAETINNYRLTK